jgi:hypothetical protein
MNTAPRECKVRKTFVAGFVDVEVAIRLGMIAYDGDPDLALVRTLSVAGGAR